MCKPWLCDLWSFRAWEGFCFVTSRKRLGEFAHEHIRMIICYVCFVKSVTSFVLFSYGFKTVLICRGSGIAVSLSHWNPFASEGTSRSAPVPFPSQHDSPVVSDCLVAWEFLAFSCIAHTTAKLQFPFLFGEPEPEPAVEPAQTIVVRAIIHSSRHVPTMPYLWGNMHSRARPTPPLLAIADGLAQPGSLYIPHC